MDAARAGVRTYKRQGGFPVVNAVLLLLSQRDRTRAETHALPGERKTLQPIGKVGMRVSPSMSDTCLAFEKNYFCLNKLFVDLWDTLLLFLFVCFSITKMPQAAPNGFWDWDFLTPSSLL